ncbi:hypothetical protein Hypma_012852 [Hypsizygus marmoreus]|uniref:Uncharacterized protein n=1 Tax=Hypsizygus marmoreus TaxID=39966 RepID=A0A369JFY4_HYPMA|nr:hypothetical protein Hypma_012852 [Hypsizygus marmoreus]
MAGVSADSVEQQYACKCLNFRIRPIPTDSVPTELVEDPNFTKVFVGEEGISVAHTQVTVRTRTKGTPIAGTSRCSRYTTITCLLCDLLVYRVYQTYPADVEGRDGPLLPTEDWVERDIMQSLTGWIEVNTECLNGKAIDEAMLSSNYSATFGLLLPPAISPSTSPMPIFERPPSRDSVSPPPPPPKFFSGVRPVFLPPPFTPSHPVFIHLSSLAAKESQAVRDAAEDFMTEQLKLKISEIEKADAELRRNVESLWKKFREGLSHIQEERSQNNHRRPSTSGSRERSTPNGTKSSTYGSPIPIRNFVPSVVSPVRTSPPSIPRVSALSASLATSSFHYPRGRAGRTSPSPSGRSASVISNGSSQSNSSTLIAPPITEGNNNVLQFPRNINESVNTAVSYQYLVNLEEDMARHRRGRRSETNKSTKTISHPQVDELSHAATAEGGGVNGDKVDKKQASGSQNNVEKPNPPTEGHEEVSSPRGREKSKGKRKVTFDVQPEVVTIKREVNSDKEEEALVNEDQREMIFDFEDTHGELTQETLNFSRPTLQLLEQPAAPVRVRRTRMQNAVGLPGSFSSLRPTSLPAPSHIRPPRSQHGSDLSSPSMMLSLPRQSILLKKEKSPVSPTASSSTTVAQPVDKIDESQNIQDAEILKLVAADTPSHRGAWKPEGKAWQTFVRRVPGVLGVGDIPEEYEDDGGGASGSGLDTTETSMAGREIYPADKEDSKEYEPPFIGSLPIPIKVGKPSKPAVLTLASYQPATLAQLGVSSPPATQKQTSSTAIRKAAYAERDRTRSMDPGALDFATEEDDEDGEEEDVEDDEGAPIDTTEAGGRGRKRALKILKARSEIPEAGMWRSLAS